MALNNKQKRYIRKYARESTLQKLASDLSLPEKEISRYLKELWKEEKYEKFLRREEIHERQNFHPAENIKSFFKNNWMQIVFITVLIIITYANTLFSGFVSDDVAVIRERKDVGEATQIFREPFVFMRNLTYFIIHTFFGKNPLPYHLINILFHTGTTILLYIIIALSLNSPVAFLTGALFAVHPLLSEPVSWVSGGTYPQHSFFVLSSLMFLIIYLRSKNKKYYYVSLIVSALAYFTADKAMMLPVYFTLYLFVFTDFKKTWKLLIAYYGIAAIWIIHYALRIPSRIESVQHEQFRKEITFNPFNQIPVAISSYLELMVWPDKLSIYHSDFIMSTAVFVMRIAISIIYGIVLIISFFKQRIIFFGLAFFIAALLPTLSPLGISSLLAERYAYLGSAGIFFIVGYLVWQITKLKKYETITYLIFMLVITAFCIRTIVRTLDWRNEDTLWIATGKTAVYDPVAHMNLGDMHRRHKNYQLAEKEFKIALELSPTNAYAYYNLGLVYTEAGAYQEALKHYEKALQFDPGLWQSYQNMSVVYDFLDNPQKSLEYIQKAVAASPDNPSLLTNMGIIYLKIGEKEKAKQAFTNSLQVDPEDEKAQKGLKDALR